MTLAAVYAMFWSVLYGYVFEDETLTLGTFGTVSLRESVSAYFEIEALFLTKQAMLTWYRGTERCVSAKYCPYIEWRKTLDADTTFFSRKVVDPKDLPSSQTKGKNTENAQQKEDGV